MQLEIKPLVGISDLSFGATMQEAEKIFGQPDDVQLIDDIEEYCATVWHYWENGFTLFFDENNNKRFNCAELDSVSIALLWGKKVFELKEKHIVELFSDNGITLYESEQHDWGEKRLSFEEANIDFYFEKNKLVSINFCKPLLDSQVLILKN